MNRTKIEWCDMTWNPVTGCLHGCSYCYARRIAYRFGLDFAPKMDDPDFHGCKYDSPEGLDTMAALDEPYRKGGKIQPYPMAFYPTFHRYKLGEPAKKTEPVTIFVSSMGDLFGSWVPDEWIKSVFTACEAAPQHTYMFLTKNPGRYLMLAYRGALPQGENYWWGTTVTNQGDYDSKGVALLNLPINCHTFFSIEPMRGPIEMGWMPNWIIIGAETGNRKNKIKPQREWIEDVARRRVTESIFMKDSLIPIVGEDELVREFPEKLKGDG